MTIKEALNRGFNLLGIGIVSLSGFAFMPEIFLEKDWDDKADDIVLSVLAIIGLWWYFSKSNRISRSVVPVVLVVLALVTKIAAIMIEFHDVENVGDDIGALVLFVLAVSFIVYQYRRTGRLLASASS